MIPDHRWVIVTVKGTTALIHSEDEVWYLIPRRRYLMTANLVDKLGTQVDRVSELTAGSSIYKPLDLRRQNMAGAGLLMLRHLDRGLGDLLFMTGLCRFVQHVSGGTCDIHLFSDLDKSQVLLGNPDLAGGSAFSGPVEYDHLARYDSHFLLESATEYDHEPDQLNVYDALFKRAGLDPSAVDPRFKRPYAHATKSDQGAFDSVCYAVGLQCGGLDLRRTGFYAVAPISTSTLRTAPYAMWLELVQMLSKELPVLVLGQTYAKTPVSDMTVGEFRTRLAELGPRVIDLVDQTPTRTTMSLIMHAKCLFCLDSGPLYIAQAYRTPAVSLWGTHHPGVRLGYDQDYMELAVWNSQLCPASPCYAHSGFPADRCPLGEQQRLCEPMRLAHAADFLGKLELVKQRTPAVGTFPPAGSQVHA